MARLTSAGIVGAMSNTRFAFALVLPFAAAIAFAGTPVGNWKGKISVKMPPMPPNMPVEQKQMVTKMMAQVAKGSLLANFRKDGTFTMKTIGMPMVPKGKESQTGKWTQKGTLVTVHDDNSKQPPQTMVLSRDGKTMVMTLPQGQGKIVFKKTV